jgi:DNA-directed RNA polymerase subunit RPC12/RpoP
MSLITRKCTECKHTEQERIESINSALVIECPECQSQTFIKQWVPANFVIK